jgi:hypothetical protein
MKGQTCDASPGGSSWGTPDAATGRLEGTFTWGGEERPLSLYIPSGGQTTSKPLPLVVAFHGWGGSRGSAFVQEWGKGGMKAGHMVLAIDGLADGKGAGGGSQGWNSWRAPGTTANSGTCAVGNRDYCYSESCGTCGGQDCSWTTCNVRGLNQGGNLVSWCCRVVVFRVFVCSSLLSLRLSHMYSLPLSLYSSLSSALSPSNTRVGLCGADAGRAGCR